VTELAKRIARVADAVSPYLCRHFIDLDDYRVLPSTASQAEGKADRSPRRSSLRLGTIGLTVFLTVIATAVPADLTSGTLENATPSNVRAADDKALPADARAWTDTMGQYQWLLAQQNHPAQNQGADAQLLSRLIVWMDGGAR
jgi:hypothetical protein